MPSFEIYPTKKGYYTGRNPKTGEKVPMQTVVKNFFATIPDYPFQPGSSLSASNIGYQTLVEAKAMEALKKLEAFSFPGN